MFLLNRLWEPSKYDTVERHSMAENKEKPVTSIPIASMLKRGEVKILLVEDDKFLRELLAGKIRKEGYTVVEAITGEEGLSKTKEERPQLILLDLVLPGMGGFDVLDAVKKDPQVSGIPVIILSNLGSREDIDKAMALGAREFMVKAHHSPQDIIEHIRRGLEEVYLPR